MERLKGITCTAIAVLALVAACEPECPSYLRTEGDDCVAPGPADAGAEARTGDRESPQLMLDASASRVDAGRSQTTAGKASQGDAATAGGAGGNAGSQAANAAGAGGMSSMELGNAGAADSGAAHTIACGDGKREDDELCDGDCPAECKSDNACIVAQLQGAAETCDARCTTVETTACGAADGCCPQGCDHGTDKDCSPSCGDGVLTGTETCEPGSADHPCPSVADCDDRDVCTEDSVTGTVAQCSAKCAHKPLMRMPINCDDGDPCTDDMMVDSATECAFKCEHSAARRPTGSCVDTDPCTDDTPRLSKEACELLCPHEEITEPIAGDMCCPRGGNATRDSDCGWCVQHAADGQCLDFDDGTLGDWTAMGAPSVSPERAASRPNSLDIGGGYLSLRTVGDFSSARLAAELNIEQTPAPPKAALCAVIEEGPGSATACATVADGSLKLVWQHCGGGACGTPFECPVPVSIALNVWTQIDFEVARTGMRMRSPVGATCEGSFAANAVAMTARLEGSSIFFDNITVGVSP